MNIYFLVAALLSLVNAAAHTFLGGREVARPLMEVAGLTDQQRWVAYYCWHAVTLVLWSMAAGFIWLALGANEFGLAVFLILLAGGFMVGGLLLPPIVKVGYKTMPQGFLFVPVVALGFLGLM